MTVAWRIVEMGRGVGQTLTCTAPQLPVFIEFKIPSGGRDSWVGPGYVQLHIYNVFDYIAPLILT
jgi:hypothetical protein